MEKPARPKSSIIRILYIAAGTFSVVLGVVGIIVPVLPTTPFLLLAAFFYLRSSHRLYRWLMNHGIWGKYLRDYTSGKGIPIRIKIWALALLWVTILSSVRLAIDQTWIRILLIFIAGVVSYHILMIKTLRNE